MNWHAAGIAGFSFAALWALCCLFAMLFTSEHDLRLAAKWGGAMVALTTIDTFLAGVVWP